MVDRSCPKADVVHVSSEREQRARARAARRAGCRDVPAEDELARSFRRRHVHTAGHAIRRVRRAPLGLAVNYETNLVGQSARVDVCPGLRNGHRDVCPFAFREASRGRWNVCATRRRVGVKPDGVFHVLATQATPKAFLR